MNYILGVNAPSGVNRRRAAVTRVVHWTHLDILWSRSLKNHGNDQESIGQAFMLNTDTCLEEVLAKHTQTYFTCSLSINGKQDTNHINWFLGEI